MSKSVSDRMNKATLFLLLTLVRVLTFAQGDSSIAPMHKKSIDQWKDKLSKATSDSSRINILQHLNFDYETENPDSSIHYGRMALQLCRVTHNLKEESRTLNGLSSVYSQQGNFAEALDLLFQGRQLAEQTGHIPEVARSYRRTGAVYWYLEDYKKAVQNGLLALELDEKISNLSSAVVDHMLLASAYESWNVLDSGLYHAQLSIKDSQYIPNILQSVFNTLGNIYLKKGDYGLALNYYRQGLDHSKTYADFRISSQIFLGMAATFRKLGKLDSSMHYARLAFTYAQKLSFRKGTMQSGRFLSELYDSLQPATALKYLHISMNARDSLYGADNTQTIQSLVAREENRRRESEAAAAEFKNRVRLYAVLAGAAALLIIAYILYRNNRRQKKVNRQLRDQKIELEKALTLLKNTQSQLIQSEKMASLGQLTAGIAHEIQNPLNFVNNFSELNEELIEEATQNLQSGNLSSAQIILKDLHQNLRKIADHGKRADAIVKSMLQHSRSGIGKIEQADLNELVTRYLSLSRHSLPAPDHGFVPIVLTEFDAGIGMLSLVPEDIGRVLVNLFENGFQALRNKQLSAVPGFEPTLTVRTRKMPGRVEIIVKDNGEGISPSIINKIFQPFFTTRPPGQGTGLGLSLSYDIISKGYHGELKVESVPDQGSVFTIILPDQGI